MVPVEVKLVLQKPPQTMAMLQPLLNPLAPRILTLEVATEADASMALILRRRSSDVLAQSTTISSRLMRLASSTTTSTFHQKLTVTVLMLRTENWVVPTAYQAFEAGVSLAS